ncbi:hypothetical protein D9619_002062 [Psilocybe cf. subviscida]|uniref:Signal recognition particle subunit SRP72 n=1 Tax=Psilocybe cf. subviscida TaxID=2480587 RepID=A0A8H5BCZ4_9AGAR|nr:hypothetical protein D9619_002062 [Psilocybe cf. subviscida]
MLGNNRPANAGLNSVHRNMPPKSASKPPVKTTKWPTNKAKPKQPLPTQEILKRLFTSLCAQIDGGHFANAVKTCDKILRLEPKDADALQTKLFLLLQTEQYDPALALIESDADPSRLAYERTYSLYRLQKETEAKDLLEDVKKSKGEDDRGILHLEAQLNYREGAYREAFELYNQLLDTAEPNSEEHSDILTNLQAAQKHLDFIERGYLQALDKLPSSITSTLESNPPPAQQISNIPVIVSSAAEQTRAAPKKVRMRRVPEGVVPGVTPPPDPERWLKKSERSTFGQGRRRKGAGGGGATQGSSVLETPSSAGTPAKSSGGKGKKKK